MFVKSIRFKIILWYGVILCLTLSLFSILIYQNFRETLYNRLDSLLLSKADGIVDSINTYWEAEKIEALRHGDEVDVYSWAYTRNFVRIAQSWVENTSELDKLNDPRLTNMVIQIFDARGRHIISSKEIPQIQVLPKDILKDVLAGKLYFNNLVVKNARNRDMRFRQLTVSVVEGKRVAYVVQVASSLDRLFFDLGSLSRLLLIFLPITVILTAVGGVFLVSLTLQPVNQMIDTIEKITAQNLETSLHVPQTNDEIQKLAETFNKMLIDLHEAFTAQKQFIQDASHELRTPLTILKGEMEVILKRLRSPEDYQKVLQSSLEEIDKLYRIVENLLVLAKLDSVTLALQCCPIDLTTLLNQTIQKIQILATHKSIQLDIASQGQAIVNGDEQYLGRLFLNLLDNAIKYTSDGGKVSVRISVAESSVKVVVQDSGPGIPEEALPHIFDRFYRADKARGGIGFGLGLSIVKSIVDLHEATIHVMSSPSTGTQFTVRFPLTARA